MIQFVRFSVFNYRSILVVLKISMSVTDNPDKFVVISIFLEGRHAYKLKLTSIMMEFRKTVVRTGGNIL